MKKQPRASNEAVAGILWASGGTSGGSAGRIAETGVGVSGSVVVHAVAVVSLRGHDIWVWDRITGTSWFDWWHLGLARPSINVLVYMVQAVRPAYDELRVYFVHSLSWRDR